MNKVIAAVGLTVLSAAFAQAQYAPGLTENEKSKDWTVAASLRGFYDDNYLTLPSSFVTGSTVVHPRIASWGTEAIPSVAWNHSAESSLISVSYVYDVRWYENHSTTDQSHQLNAGFQKEFNERYKLALTESFVMAQEPTVIDPSVITSPLRVNGINIRTTSTASFTDSNTKTLDLHLGYNNTVYAYPELANSVIGYPFTGTYTSYGSPQPSYSALLNRMEQLATIDLDWKVTDTTTALVGYQYGATGYTSGEFINYPYGPSYPYATPPGYPAAGGKNFLGDRSNVRNSYSHYGFLGVDHNFTSQFSASIRAGGEYIDYYNNVDQFGNSAPTSLVSPYIDASLSDQYQNGCTVQLGVKHVHNATDVIGLPGDANSFYTIPVVDEETTAIYLSDTHKITERLTATMMGQAQLSTFNAPGSTFNGQGEEFFILQIRLAYAFSPWLSGEAGYDYNRLKSDLPDRAYTRDFMYLGVRATY